MVDELGRIANYRPRLADGELQTRLRATGAVLIEGARGCGKTQTGLRAAKSAVRLDRDRAARQAAELDPSLVLSGRERSLSWQSRRFSLGPRASMLTWLATQLQE